MTNPRTLTFRNSGYFFLAILLIAILGFVPSYFPGLTGREVTFNGYTHFHAAMMTLWLGLLITQPFLIKHGHREWHHRLGKVSFVLLPMVMIAALLLMHDRLHLDSEEPLGIRLFIPLKDLIIIGPLYALAMNHRKNPAYHARFIVGSSFQLVEPGLVRALLNLFPFPNPLFAALVTWGTIDAMILYLIVKDRHLAKGRWIFPLVLCMTLSVQVFLIAGGPQLPFFVRFAEWFVARNLT